MCGQYEFLLWFPEEMMWSRDFTNLCIVGDVRKLDSSFGDYLSCQGDDVFTWNNEGALMSV